MEGEKQRGEQDYVAQTKGVKMKLSADLCVTASSVLNWHSETERGDRTG